MILSNSLGTKLEQQMKQLGISMQTNPPTIFDMIQIVTTTASTIESCQEKTFIETAPIKSLLAAVDMAIQTTKKAKQSGTTYNFKHC